jgi:hypothetical protein
MVTHIAQIDRRPPKLSVDKRNHLVVLGIIEFVGHVGSLFLRMGGSNRNMSIPISNDVNMCGTLRKRHVDRPVKRISG